MRKEGALILKDLFFQKESSSSSLGVIKNSLNTSGIKYRDHRFIFVLKNSPNSPSPPFHGISLFCEFFEFLEFWKA